MPAPYWQKPRGGYAEIIGWNAGSTLQVVMLAAGHTPGLYSIDVCVVVRVAASAGTAARSILYSAPNFGSTSIAGFGGSSLTVAGNPVGSFTTLSVMSDGSGPVTFQFVPAGVTGSPSVDVYCMASKVN